MTIQFVLIKDFIFFFKLNALILTANINVRVNNLNSNKTFLLQLVLLPQCTSPKNFTFYRVCNSIQNSDPKKTNLRKRIVNIYSFFSTGFMYTEFFIFLEQKKSMQLLCTCPCSFFSFDDAKVENLQVNIQSRMSLDRDK